MNDDYQSIFEKCLQGGTPEYEEAVELLKLDVKSPEFYALCQTANQISHEQFDGKGDVCAQIGLDYDTCSFDCGFCSFSDEADLLDAKMTWKPKKVVKVANEMIEAGANAVFLMTTGQYPFEQLVEIGKKVKDKMVKDIPMIANTRDFSYNEAQKLKEAGFNGVYHALRLREGTDSDIPKERRIKTIENAKKAGLLVQVCLEPVGPEHTPEELADQMFWAKETGVRFNGAMHRTIVPGTPLYEKGQISHLELAKSVAVSRLVAADEVDAHCTHEPHELALISGANLLWAEAGTNPRELVTETRKSRGQSVKKCQEILINSGYELREGASPACISK